MSDVNSKLPDEEALAAFANSATGGNRRRRRRQEEESTGDGTNSPTPSPTGEETPANDTVPEAEPSAETTSAPDVEEEASPDVDTANRLLRILDDPATTLSHAQLSDLFRAVDEAHLLSYQVPGRDMTFAAILNERMIEAKTAAEKSERRTSVPSQTSPADDRSDDASTVEDDTSKAEEAESDTSTKELEVRAVTVPATLELLPPGLVEGGVVEVRVPDLGRAGTDPTQCTIMISSNVRDRFSHYQLEKKMAGEPEPANAMVVRRAFLHARRHQLFGEILRNWYHQTIAVDQEDYDEDGLLGEVVGRRSVRGRVRDSGQQSFRPSRQELATYDAFQTAYGFTDRSAFLEGVLDKFLPELPASRRRR
ncbi:hypothetical protein ACUXZZ_45135 (plasmid) [Streptomyces graminifolii]|uniref:hypothetical protein n=1 Tax=Streptomyces graminifolii TaxID=1266771 RepID=UPI004057ED2D